MYMQCSLRKISHKYFKWENREKILVFEKDKTLNYVIETLYVSQYFLILEKDIAVVLFYETEFNFHAKILRKKKILCLMKCNA